MYTVIRRFADLQDEGYIYEAGDTFPRPDFDVTDERIAELAGRNNRAGYPLIAAVPKRPAKKRVSKHDRADLRTDQ